MNREELLAKIRKIVGGKKFVFRDVLPTIGDEDRPYTGVTKTYLHISCRVVYGWNEEETEVGAKFRRYSVYKDFKGENVSRVKLDDLFTKDLQKVYDDMVFHLWKEKHIHLKEVEKEYKECLEYCMMYDRIEPSDTESIQNDAKEK